MQDTMIGRRIDKYEITARLGAGAMGAVYEAKHVATSRRVAIKVILGEIIPDESLIARFQREARAAGAIESRHIAQVLDAGKDAETNAPYLVMELLQGEDADTLVKRLTPLPPSLALRIVAQALAGLERAHAASVIHRDIKPANLFVARTDGGQLVVKIVDFGIAKVRDNLTSSREHALTQTSALLGSPLFMSPEQARASKSVDGRADLWSLGVVLYQMLAGRAPHADAETLTELLLAICTSEAAPIQDAAPWVAPEIAQIVTKALALDIRDRYATAVDMREAIARVVPDWQQLDDAMLVPLGAEERAIVADRAAPTGLGTATGPKQLPLEAGATLADGASAISAHGATGAGLSATNGDRSTRRRSLVWPVAIGVAVLGGGAYALRASKGPPAPPPAALVAPPPPEATVVAPPVTPSASVVASAPPPPVVPVASSAVTSSAARPVPPSRKPLVPEARPTTTAPPAKPVGSMDREFR